MNLTRLALPSLALAALAAIAVTHSGCTEGKYPTGAALPPLNPAKLDETAGGWKMVFLADPAAITVSAPSAVTSTSYREELGIVGAAGSSLSNAQKTLVDYWSGGGVLRWNEIMRGLAARFDLPPAPRDGAYPAPSAANPFADPQFPFSNPPYSARAYSYVSVAQYDALKVAWFYKYAFNRPAPAKVDPSISPLVPITDLPAYPSEDAVLAGVTSTLLTALFPVAADEIARHAQEQQDFALMAGKAAPSDLEAGVALGRAVAAQFLARARTDGMAAAGGNAAVYQGFADAANARGEVPWRSLETPPRPGMLPLFGKVRAWMLTPADIVAVRPGPPPSTSSEQMKRELAEVKNAVENITREQLATVYNWSDGVNTWSPPGHWNFIAANFVRDARFSEVRAARAFALLNMSQHDAAVSCWDTKYTYFNPRPSQLDPSIRTVVGLPNFPAYTSGHSTFSAAAATVLSYLFPTGAGYFDAQKEEAALSRLYGGIHYRSDIEVGKQCGTRVAEFTVGFARTDGAGE